MENKKENNMTELTGRIQRTDNLNDVYYVDVAGPGNGRHLYSVSTKEQPSEVLAVLQFQNGGRNVVGSVPGVLDEDLLEIVRHRLQCFQRGEFPTREGACALTHIEEALMWLNKRKEDRKERGVLGKHEK